MRTFIIAEAGVNHNGDAKTAKRLVDAAVDAGADAVKFQTFKTENIVTKSADKAAYQKQGARESETQYQMLKKLELSFDAHRELFDYCLFKNIIFMSTAFDEQSADMLDELGMRIFKIPSGEITNKPLIKHVAAKCKPVILSTGMSTLGEVEKAVGWLKDVWDKKEKHPELTLLHCVSSYPAPPEEANLRAMRTMSDALGIQSGYSDHTLGIEIALAAVALGAAVIEKHFTLDRAMPGPDHKASLEPGEFGWMVSAIRNIESAIGDGIKRPTSAEIDTKAVARRSLVASRNIKSGEIIRIEDIAIKRPGTGIAPEYKDMVIGMRAGHDMAADSVIRWKDLKDA